MKTTSDRSLDKFIAQNIMGFKVSSDSRGALREAVNGDGVGMQTRPLRFYSTDMNAAWEVATKIGVTMLPTDEGWFCLVGPENKWRSPANFIEFLTKADFVKAGASVSVDGPMAICIAALRWYENLESRADSVGEESEADVPDNLISMQGVKAEMFEPGMTV